MQDSTVKIPVFYRIFFIWVDPIIATWSAYMNFFSPDIIFNSFVPNSIRNPEYDMLFQQLGGARLNLAFINAVLLRYTTDHTIWKIIQWAILIVDFVGLYSFWAALSRQGRLDPTIWRGEDWGCGGIIGVFTLVRCLFVAEVGFKGKVKRVKRL